MKRIKEIIITAILLILGNSYLFCFNNTLPNDSIWVWTEFVEQLKSGEFTIDKICSFNEQANITNYGYIIKLQENISWEEMEIKPEVYINDNKYHYIIPLTYENPDTMTYCFNFTVENEQWYFHSLEMISIRIDNISNLPVSEFPDLHETTKAWMREENDITKDVCLFNLLSKEKDRAFAFNWFMDGMGYATAARMWIPFHSSAKAFILYLCWEQANQKYNKVTLEKLNDKEAVVKIKSNYFLIYKNAMHLKDMISFEDYRKIFETRWQNRAYHAGWNIEIEYEDENCTLNFSKRE